MAKDDKSELEKWGIALTRARILFEFKEWLDYQKGITGSFPESAIYEFFNIDTAKLEKERSELLDSVRRKAQ